MSPGHFCQLLHSGYMGFTGVSQGRCITWYKRRIIRLLQGYYRVIKVVLYIVLHTKSFRHTSVFFSNILCMLSNTFFLSFLTLKHLYIFNSVAYFFTLFVYFCLFLVLTDTYILLHMSFATFYPLHTLSNFCVHLHFFPKLDGVSTVDKQQKQEQERIPYF